MGSPYPGLRRGIFLGGVSVSTSATVLLSDGGVFATSGPESGGVRGLGRAGDGGFVGRGSAFSSAGELGGAVGLGVLGVGGLVTSDIVSVSGSSATGVMVWVATPFRGTVTGFRSSGDSLSKRDIAFGNQGFLNVFAFWHRRL